MRNDEVKFIDLFAGIGGIRIGFENALKASGFKTKCVMTSEIKQHAISNLESNFTHDLLVGDITKVPSQDVPDFDFLLAGFPCQPFSAAGNRLGFVDTRGTLFFDIERILRDKRPEGFILENVEGLVKHDLEKKGDEIGKTLRVILDKLENDLGYQVSWKVLDSKNFGVSQSRKRIFIVGTKSERIGLGGFEERLRSVGDDLEYGQQIMNSKFAQLLLSHFELDDLHGKSVKDKRGGDNNIHSWDIELKGPVSEDQTLLLNKLFKERRKKQWAKEIGIDWMDGMPLTLDQISTFHEASDLQESLDDLVSKGYLRFEHPKKLVKENTPNGVRSFRSPDESKPKGYNIVTGKLSFEINKILDPNSIAPTLVATDLSKIAVADHQSNGLRRLTKREGLRLLGFPEWYEINGTEDQIFDLLGNSVAVPVVDSIASRISDYLLNQIDHSEKALQA